MADDDDGEVEATEDDSDAADVDVEIVVDPVAADDVKRYDEEGDDETCGEDTKEEATFGLYEVDTSPP